MSSIFIVYDAHGNITNATTSYPQVTPPASLLVVDETVPNASSALSQPSHFMVQNNQILPTATIQIDRQHAINGSYVDWTLHLKTSDNLEHDIAFTFNGFNDSYTIAPDTGLTLTLRLHQSLAQHQFWATFSGVGIVTNSVPVGGSDASPVLIGTQVYKDAQQALHLAPAGPGSRQYLTGYWSGTVAPYAALVDLATGLGLIMHTLFGIVLPAVNEARSVPVSLTPNQQNALDDIKASIFPLIATTLETAAPKPADGQDPTYDIHYSSYRGHMMQAAQAMQNYGNDLINIPNIM